MDKNLYFRTSIPAWVGLLTLLVVSWAMGNTSWIGELSTNNYDALLAIAVALFGSPAIGYLLNTIIIVMGNIFQAGPEYARVFDEYQERAYNELSEHNDVIRNARPAALVACIEYPSDPTELLEWRRRQRAGFFAAWANILAIIFGATIGLSISHRPIIHVIVTGIILVLLPIGVYIWLVKRYMATHKHPVRHIEHVYLKRLLTFLAGIIVSLVLSYMITNANPFIGSPICETQRVRLFWTLFVLIIFVIGLTLNAVKSEQLADGQHRVWLNVRQEGDFKDILEKPGAWPPKQNSTQSPKTQRSSTQKKTK